MSNDLGPFKDVRVRQAMNYAVDKDAINKGLYGGATTASQGMPPVLWGYNKSVRAVPVRSGEGEAAADRGGVRERVHDRDDRSTPTRAATIRSAAPSSARRCRGTSPRSA